LEEKYNKLLHSLLSIHNRSKVFHVPNRCSNPKKNAVNACSWITEEIEGILKELGIDINSELEKHNK